MRRNLKLHVVNNNDSATNAILFEDDNESLPVIQMTLVTELNQAGMLTVTIPSDHPQYDFNYKIIGTVCSLIFNGSYGTAEPFWRGRLFSVDVNLRGDKTLVFEGLLSRLATMPIVPGLITISSDTARTQLSRVLNAYRYGKLASSGTATCGTAHFTIGTVPAAAEDSTKKIDLSDLTEEDTLLTSAQHVITKLNQKADGTFYIKQGGTYLTEINIAQIDTAHKDTIRTNMIKSYSANLNGEPFANRVYAYGTADDNDVRRDLTSVTTGNVPYIEKKTGDYGVDDIGVVAKTVIYDSVKTAARLLNCANRELTKAFKNSRSYTVEMVDTYALNGEYTHFYAGKAVKFNGVGVLSGFDTYISGRTYDFLNPLNDSIIIEQSKKKLTSQL